MDWISTTTGCFAVSNAVAETALHLGHFVNDVHESRAELTALSAELHALDGVLDLLKDDAASAAFPDDMALQTPAVVAGSGAVVASLDSFFTACDQPGIDKRERWLAMLQTMERARAALEVYRLTLGLALDLAACTADESRSQSKDVARILAETGHLRGRMHGDPVVDSDATLTLRNYLNVLQKHAQAVRQDTTSTAGRLPVSPARSSPVGKLPDSAVDRPRDKGFGHSLSRSLDLDLDSIPSRAPTPPPKAAARGSSALGFHDHDRSNSNASANVRVSDVPTLKPCDGFRELRESLPSSPVPTVATDNEDSNPSANTSLSIRSRGCASSILSGGDGGSRSGSAASASASSSSSRFSRFLRTMRSTASGFSEAQTDDTIQRPATSSSTDATDAVAGTNDSNGTPNATTAITSEAQSDRSGSRLLALPLMRGKSTRQPTRRLSTTLRTPWTPPIVTPSITTTVSSTAVTKKPSTVAGYISSKLGRDKDTEASAGEPDSVFGVSLRKSINIAASSARTHHSGGSKTSDTKGGSSRRQFPLCIFKCYTYIRQDGGLFTPDIFGGGIPNVVDDATMDVVNWGRVQTLRSAFSRAPDYGATLDLAAAGYSHHDAAALILQYLEALPRPLVPDAVVRRWITLSRQATVAASYAKRLDQCIDFWEEAFGGVRGPARSLLKLLLNLWGDVADAADHNEMTAERLASRIMKPLLHFEQTDKDKERSTFGSSSRNQTDYMLSLAFIIRRRSEYSLLLRGGDRKSNAAFVA